MATVVGQFSMSQTTRTITDWVTIFGTPHLTVLSGSDSRSGSPVTLSSVTASLWGVTAGASSAQNAGQTTANPTYALTPAEIWYDYWFNADPLSYTGTNSNLLISGLNNSKTYTVEVGMSRNSSVGGTRNSRIWITSNSGTSGQSVNAVGNSTTILTFTNQAPVGGSLVCYVYRESTSYSFGYLNWVKITQEGSASNLYKINNLLVSSSISNINGLSISNVASWNGLV